MQNFDSGFFFSNDTKQDYNNTPDYRATLYWNPSLTTDKDGNATIEFYNSDAAK